MITYETIAERFADYGCQLLTTKEEFKDGKMTADSKYRVLMSCGHERDYYRKHLANNNLCKECTILKCKNETYYVRMVKRFADANCTLLTTKEEYVNNKMTIFSTYNFIASCGHENCATISFLKKNTEGVCKVCAKKKKYDDKRLPYEEVLKRFTENKCELLTSKEEYYEKGMNVYSNYKVIASCGHERECALSTLKSCEETLCITCTRKKDSDSKIGDNGKTDGVARGNVIEYNAYKYLETKLSDYFDVKKLREGTLADCIIKPKYLSSDEWLQVQIKSTENKREKNNEYIFGIRKHYEDMIICCICVKDDFICSFNGNISLLTTTIHITEKSKYYAGVITDNRIIDRFISHYNDNEIAKVKYADANIPISLSCKVEYEYQLLRENQLGNFFEFIYPELEGQVFDFTVNNFKVQEKVGHLLKSSSVPCIESHLSKNGGLGKRKPYDIGDNDYYWIACPDKDTFYIFPESILVEKQYISQDTETSAKYKHIFLHFKAKNKEELVNCQTKDDWTFTYRYNYSNLDIDKLKSLFKMD